MLQAEFARTEVFDRPVAGRVFFEEVMRENLRRLRLRGLIERIPNSQRYRLTAEGLCIALAYHRTQARVLGPVLSATLDGESTTRLRAAIAAYDREVGHLWEGQALAA